MNNLVKIAAMVIDICFIPVTILSAIWMKILRIGKNNNFPLSWYLLKKIKVIPIINHYYEPLIDEKDCMTKKQTNNFPGIDFNINEQISLLDNFTFNNELNKFWVCNKKNWKNNPVFNFDNNMLKEYDAKVLYSMIRHFQPKRIIEIGSGFSTLLSIEAIKINVMHQLNDCKLFCIEPYENLWLNKVEATVIRKKVEDVDLNFFRTLEENDILFIDSSHIIRPGGDVLYEYLEILPSLNRGVFVHIHDIFTPYNYLREWMFELYYFWNEQYLLEAFLTNNKDYKVILTNNYLKHYDNNILAKKLFIKDIINEPGSFWIQKVN